jgi:hypothetical protein
VALARVIDHSLERPGAGPHALDRDHLALDREDRLDLQRRADPRAGGADPPPAPKELERVDREPHLQLRARAPGALGDLVRVRSRRRGGGRRERHQAEAAGRGGGVEHPDPLAALAVALEHLRGLAGRLGGAGQPAGDVDRDHLAPAREQRLVGGGEVADRRLRGGGQRLGLAQLLEERRVVGDVGLRHGALAAVDDVERDDLDPVPLDQIRRQVGRAVGHDGDVRHPAAPYMPRPTAVI